jgi:hypothetical protein
MDVVTLPEFSRCMLSVTNSGADARQVEELLRRLSAEHAAPDMQGDRVRVPGTDIELWAARAMHLSGGDGRVTWRYEERNGRPVIVCFALVQV